MEKVLLLNVSTVVCKVCAGDFSLNDTPLLC